MTVSLYAGACTALVPVPLVARRTCYVMPKALPVQPSPYCAAQLHKALLCQPKAAGTAACPPASASSHKLFMSDHMTRNAFHAEEAMDA